MNIPKLLLNFTSEIKALSYQAPRPHKNLDMRSSKKLNGTWHYDLSLLREIRSETYTLRPATQTHHI